MQWMTKNSQASEGLDQWKQRMIKENAEANGGHAYSKQHISGHANLIYFCKLIAEDREDKMGGMQEFILWDGWSSRLEPILQQMFSIMAKPGIEFRRWPMSRKQKMHSVAIGTKMQFSQINRLF